MRTHSVPTQRSRGWTATGSRVNEPKAWKEHVLRGDYQPRWGTPSDTVLIDLASNWLRSFFQIARKAVPWPGLLDALLSTLTVENKEIFKGFPHLSVSAREGVIMTSWPERFQRGFFQLLLQVTQRPSKGVKQTGKAACLDQSQRQLGESCLCFFGFRWLKTGNFGSHSRTL